MERFRPMFDEPQDGLRFASLSGGLRSRLSIDSRALAAFRISLGVLVIGDLIIRWQDLRSFYTDSGVLPRSTLAELYPRLAQLSLHALGGSATSQRILFAVAGFLALLVIAGYRTRLTVVLLFVLHASLYVRNPYLLNGGDGLLVMSLFLGAFLPLGERWSVDAVRRQVERRTRVDGLASAVILAQLVIVYVANAGFKLQSEAWMSGNGVRYALELEQFAVYLAPAIRELSPFVIVVNWLWIAMLALSPLLLVLRGWPRFVAVMGYVSAHLGMALTLRLGLFPFVVIALLVLYIPTCVWERIDGHLVGRSVVEGWLSPISAIGSGGRRRVPPKIRRAGRILAIAVLVGFLIVSIAWPASEVAGERGFDPGVETDGYVWTLFAPDPPTESRWFVASITLRNGERIDGFTGRDVEWEKPAEVLETYPSTLWHRYLEEIRFSTSAERHQLATYLCREGNAEHDTRAMSVAIYVVEEPIPAIGGGDAERQLLVETEC